jgi:hypothetical protein
MTDKPCPRCEGIHVDWENVDQIWICQKHLREVFQELRAKGFEYDNSPPDAHTEGKPH